MREIKFRAWKENFVPGGGFLDWDFLRDEHASLLNNEDYIIMQYTGLHDKNGKEIYRDDIHKSKWGIGRIFWDEKSCSFDIEIQNFKGSLSAFDLHTCLTTGEVIGNIHENPKLLKEAPDGD